MDSFVLTLSVPTTNVFQLFFTYLYKDAYNSADLFTKNYDFGKMKTDIKANLLDDLIIVNTFGKVVKFEIKKQVFFRGWHFCHPVGTLRVKVEMLILLAIM